MLDKRKKREYNINKIMKCVERDRTPLFPRLREPPYAERRRAGKRLLSPASSFAERGFLD